MALRNAMSSRVPEHTRYLARPSEDIRQRDLVRLYERRCAVDNLIHALERYQEDEQRVRPAKRAPVRTAEMRG
jgi:hypothetical protein